MAEFKKIGLALAFSPTAEAILAKTLRLIHFFDAHLIIIHVGQHNLADEDKMKALLKKAGADRDKTSITWEEGEPSRAILRACKRERIDLLVIGALKKENILEHYLGSVARKILRKAPCSVLTLMDSSQDKATRNIVVNAEDTPYITEAISLGCQVAQKENALWVHIVREVKLYGLTMAASDHFNEEEYDDMRQKLVKEEIDKVEALLQRIPHENIKINIKILSGKSGFELSRFAERKNADLLVVGAPARRFSFLDRVFPHDLEYIFANLPCNILVVNPRSQRKESPHG
jgi:nucleotide-binding universal stress UspA family protein